MAKSGINHGIIFNSSTEVAVRGERELKKKGRARKPAFVSGAVTVYLGRAAKLRARVASARVDAQPEGREWMSRRTIEWYWDGVEARANVRTCRAGVG